MQGIRKLVLQLKGLNTYSKMAVKLGLFLMICFYIVAIVAYLYADRAADYFHVMSVYRGSLEAAPACLAVGVVAGLLGDLMLSGAKGRDDSPHE